MATTTPDPEAIRAVRLAESMLRIRIDEARSGLHRGSRMHKELTNLLDQARDLSHDLDYIVRMTEARAGLGSTEPQHLRQGKPAPPEGWPYGALHDPDCPACIGTAYTASPRSESYWSS